MIWWRNVGHSLFWMTVDYDTIVSVIHGSIIIGSDTGNSLMKYMWYSMIGVDCLTIVIIMIWWYWWWYCYCYWHDALLKLWYWWCVILVLTGDDLKCYLCGWLWWHWYCVYYSDGLKPHSVTLIPDGITVFRLPAVLFDDREPDWLRPVVVTEGVLTCEGGDPSWRITSLAGDYTMRPVTVHYCCYWRYYYW